MPLLDGLICHYEGFTDGGTTLTDSHSNSLNMTTDATIVTVEDGVVSPRSLDWDGNGGNANVSNDLLIPGAALTVAAWVKFGVVTGHQTIAGVGTSSMAGAEPWRLKKDFTGARPYFSMYNVYREEVIESTAVVANQWYLFVAGWDSATSKSFLTINDGAHGQLREETDANFYPVRSDYNQLWLGSMNGSDDAKCLINAFSVWDRRLTAEEITELYNEGNGLAYASWTATAEEPEAPVNKKSLFFGMGLTLFGYGATSGGGAFIPDPWAIDGRNIKKDGENFLPLGMYYSDYSLTVQHAKDTLLAIKNLGGNCAVVTLSIAQQEVADYAASIGLDLWIEANDGAGSAAVAAHYKDHPAVAGFMIYDDVNNYSIPQLTAERNAIQAAAPGAVLMGSGDYQVENVFSALPIPGVQIYPVAPPGESMIAMAASYATTVFNAIVTGGKPCIFNLQTYKGGDRWPTVQELRNMCWQAIIRGANGIITYTSWGFDAVAEDFFGEGGVLVAELTELFKELDDNKEGILNESRVRGTTGSAYSEIAYFDCGSHYLVVALNASDTTDPENTQIDNLSVSLALPADATGTMTILNSRYDDVLTRTGTTVSGILDAEQVSAYTVFKS